MSKHAFLVMLHNQYKLASMLLSMLDDEEVDFYIHVDKKASFTEEDMSLLLSNVLKSKVFFVDRINVVWGDFSQIQAELTLLKEAIKVRYSYYHLISGVDFPLRSIEDIKSFFDAETGKEFVHFGRSDMQEIKQKRSMYYWILQNEIGNQKTIAKDKNLKRAMCFLVQTEYVMLQKLFHVDRRRKNLGIKFASGSNWFSITYEFAYYVLQKEQWIYDTFQHTKCCDEVFLQTILLNSDFYKSRYHQQEFDADYRANLRYIDFNRGKPYVFTNADINELQNVKDYLFTRKFDYETNPEVVDALYKAHKKLK